MKSNEVTEMTTEAPLPNSESESGGKEGGHDVDDWLQAESELTVVAMKAAA